MAESENRFTEHAGRIYFPRGIADLTSTAQCPACFSPLDSTICRACQLDLNHPSASELAKVSTDAAALLGQRVELVGKMRFETAQLLAARGSATPAVVPAAAASVPWASPEAPAAAQSVATTTVREAAGPSPTRVVPPTAPSAPAAPRRSSIQIILLFVGVFLLSVAAIFFLVYAFLNFGLIWRTVIIGAITVAAFTAASLLRRRNLTASAEGIAVFAIVLVYLDAFALRANDLFGLGDADASVYWGTTLLLSAIGFIGWNRASGLRVPSIAAFAAFVPGAAFLVAGIAEPLDGELRSFLALSAGAVAGLIHPLASRPATEARRALDGTLERITVLSLASLCLLGAFVVAFVVLPNSDWASSVALVAVTAIAAVHVTVLLRAAAPTSTAVFATGIAILGGVSAAVTGVPAAIRIGEWSFAVIGPVVIAVVVALALEFAAKRAASVLMIRAVKAAGWAAATIAGIAILPAALTALASLALLPRSLAFAWDLAPDSTLFDATSDNYLAIGALVVVCAIAAAFWALGAQLVRRRGALAWAIAVVLVLAVPLLATSWAITAGWLVLGGGAVATLIVSKRRGGMSRTITVPLVAIAITSTLCGYLVSWASIDLWWIGTLATIAIVLAARRSNPAAGSLKAVLLSVAMVVAFIGAGALARQLAIDEVLTLTPTVDELRFVGILAIVVTAASALPALSVLDRRTAFWLSVPIAAASGAAAHYALSQGSTPVLLPEFGTSLIVSMGFFAALVLWITSRETASFRPERIAASIAIAPTVYWVVDSFVRLLGLPEFAESVAPATSALIVATGALTVTVLRPSSTPRWARELGIGIVAVPAVVVAVTGRTESAWLTLVLAGITALLLAVSSDGLFASASPRKHFGWLALTLATAGLWWRLADDGVTRLEPFVLPLTAALLIVALLVWRPTRATAQQSQAAPLIALAALLVSILPLSVDSTNGEEARTIIVAAVSAALVLLSSFVAGNAQLRPYLDVAALAGAIGVLVSTIGRANVIRTENLDDVRLDLWLGAAVVTLVIAAIGQARTGSDDSSPARPIVSQVLVAIVLTSVVVLESAAMASDRLGEARAIVLIIVLSGFFVVATIVRTAPFTMRIAWISLALAVVSVIAGIVHRVLDPIEFGTLPIAVALLIAGVLHLRRAPDARSWPHLGPGVAVLLLPSLIATLYDRPFWRLVALGLVAVSVLIVGLLTKLQAPFILGAVVAVVHGYATFEPQIRAVYEAVAWPYWAGIAGLVIFVLAVRYEKSLKGFRDVATSIGSLR